MPTRSAARASSFVLAHPRSTLPPSISLPQLIKCLLHSGDAVSLALTLGPFELGCVVVRDGALWDADVPGARGDEAFALLCQVSSCHAHFRAVEASRLPTRTIVEGDRYLREATVDDDLVDAVAQARRSGSLHVGEVRGGETTPRPIDGLSLPPHPVPAGREDSVFVDDGMQEAYETFFRAGTQAYLRHDFARALEAFEACLRLRPGDRRVLHNLERLKTRVRAVGTP